MSLTIGYHLIQASSDQIDDTLNNITSTFSVQSMAYIGGRVGVLILVTVP